MSSQNENSGLPTPAESAAASIGGGDSVASPPNEVIGLEGQPCAPGEAAKQHDLAVQARAAYSTVLNALERQGSHADVSHIRNYVKHLVWWAQEEHAATSPSPTGVQAGQDEEEDSAVPGMSYCMGVNLEGLLINGKKSYKGLVSDDNDNVLSPRDTRAWILDQIRKGHWVVPMGECENWNYTKGRCMGHLPTTPSDEQ